MVEKYCDYIPYLSVTVRDSDEWYMLLLKIINSIGNGVHDIASCSSAMYGNIRCGYMKRTPLLSSCLYL